MYSLENISKMREFLKNEKLDYLLVNSTNQFLVEYSALDENSRYKLTGFSGSTGDALLSADKLYLFVDGRYHIQADNEVDLSVVEVVKLQVGQLFLDVLAEKIESDKILGVFAKKNSQSRMETLAQKLADKNITIKMLDFDLLDSGAAPKEKSVVELDKSLTGKTTEEKIQEISAQFKENQALVLTNPEEVSYLFNLRDFSQNYSCYVNAKAVIDGGAAHLFDEKNLGEFYEFILFYSGEMLVDKSTISAYDYHVIGDKARTLKDSPVKLMKAVKTQEEIESYKDAFSKTDSTMYAIRDFINENDNLSEFDIAKKLEEEYKRFGAKSLSFKSIVAKDKNSASAHYSKSSKEEIIKDGSLVLIDCGAFYDGGLATDITRVFVKGEPNDLQKKVYTTVLKTFLNAFNMQGFKTGFDIDSKAREIVEENPIEGFVFNHGLGHGIGINVHECPPNLGTGEQAKVEIKDNMCFTIEPGLYNAEHFGVRLENSCYLENGKIKSFTNMCYERKLINYDMLNEQEKEWLNHFEVR